MKTDSSVHQSEQMLLYRKMEQAGYREHEHTADWELEVWAPNLKGLLEQAARGMYKMAGVLLQPETRIYKTVSIHAADMESLLVMFLQELLYYGEIEDVGFDDFQLQLSGLDLSAELEGAAIAHRSKEIKAVTYHNLMIRQDGPVLRVHIVFDV